MTKILIGKVKVNNSLLYTEEIINLLMLGNSSRHQLYVDSLESGPITFRKVENIYSAQFQDKHWKINKKETKPQKLYVIDENTVLNCGNVLINFQRIKEDQLDVVKDTTPMTRRQNISDLLAKSKEDSEQNLTPSAKNFLSKIRSPFSKGDKKDEGQKKVKIKKIKIDNELDGDLEEFKPNAIISLPSIIFQFSLTYLFLVYFDKISNYLKISNDVEKIRALISSKLLIHLPLKKFEGVLATLTSKLPFKFDSSSFSIINTSIIEIIEHVLFFLALITILKIIQSLLLGAQFSYFVSGVKIKGSLIVTRLKALLREILSLILFPLSVFNPMGLIPLKSLPDFILRIKFLKKSFPRIIFGALINLTLSMAILLSPLLINQIHEHKLTTIGLIKSHKKPNLDPLNFQLIGNDSIELMLPSTFSIESKEITDKITITHLSTKKSKARFSSIMIPESIKVNIENIFLEKYPLSVVFYPALHFQDKIKENLIFYQSTRNRRNKERQKLVYSSLLLSKEPNSLLKFIKTNGPFFWGSSNLKKELGKIIQFKQNINLYEGKIDSNPSVIMHMDNTLYFFQFKNENTTLFSIQFDDLSDLKETLPNIFDPVRPNLEIPQLEEIQKNTKSNKNSKSSPESIIEYALDKINKLKISLSL
jgi:hypothetical protein